jgi:hypothetical protein
MHRTPEAASEFPADPIPEDGEEQNQTVTPEEEVILPSAPPLEEVNAQLKEVIARLSWRALQQVRQ